MKFIQHTIALCILALSCVHGMHAGSTSAPTKKMHRDIRRWVHQYRNKVSMRECIVYAQTLLNFEDNILISPNHKINVIARVYQNLYIPKKYHPTPLHSDEITPAIVKQSLLTLAKFLKHPLQPVHSALAQRANRWHMNHYPSTIDTAKQIKNYIEAHADLETPIMPSDPEAIKAVTEYKEEVTTLSNGSHSAREFLYKHTGFKNKCVQWLNDYIEFNEACNNASLLLRTYR